MPCKGPGPRQRRATKIANRSHVTPFDKLAQWNAQIMRLGTQGAVPSIVGNSLEFVKLTAADIPGVMNNPATADLVMKHGYKAIDVRDIGLRGPRIQKSYRMPKREICV